MIVAISLLILIWILFMIVNLIHAAGMKPVLSRRKDKKLILYLGSSDIALSIFILIYGLFL